ncbi:MAG TPA: orotate phosphoribosyltransferase [Fimbriimonadaceae bacterium]|nr:orotate phosphoribosyltransferase [Fimbriimonadaceae bacterium]
MLKGHFVLTSGRHSEVYFEKFRVLEKPQVLSALCAQIAEAFKDRDVDYVVGPTTGGIIVAFEVARQLGVDAIYVESESGQKTLRRGATIPEGSRVLLVDDVLTTGLSLREVESLVTNAGARVVGAACLIDRSEREVGLSVPVFGAYRVEAKSFPPEDIPEWLAAIPTTKPGTRK